MTIEGDREVSDVSRATTVLTAEPPGIRPAATPRIDIATLAWRKDNGMGRALHRVQPTLVVDVST
jgi:hypothetical protein